METYELDHNLFKRETSGDQGLFVLFYMGFRPNEEKTREEGRPIFVDAEFVKIFAPGDRTNIIDRPATAIDKQRFKAQYDLFKESKDQRGDGLPLAEWPVITRSQAEELKFLGFHTVELLAHAGDEGISRFPGGVTLRDQARAYLEVAKEKTGPIMRLTAELEQEKANNRQMQEALKEVQAELKLLRKKAA